MPGMEERSMMEKTIKKDIWEMISSVSYSTHIAGNAGRADQKFFEHLQEGIADNDLDKIYEFIDAYERGKSIKPDELVCRLFQKAYREDSARLCQLLAEKNNIVDYWIFLSTCCETDILVDFAKMDVAYPCFYYECARILLKRTSGIDEKCKEAIIAAVKRIADRDLALYLKDRDFTAISDGQRQRILLARAICQEPEIIILDEPTSFLDIRHKLELLAILKKMVLEKQMTVIMSLHELDLAQKISDQVICVHGDHIEKYGAPEEIFTSDYIRKLYGITRGSYNAEFGCVEMEPPAGKPEVFVIGGNGSGIPVYRKLQRQGIPFVTGVLHTNDADYQVAKELAAKVITEKPFECISESAFEEALEFMGKCEKVYCPLKDFGIMNEKNRELLKKAKETGKLNRIR